jgi:hypothetical protein
MKWRLLDSESLKDPVQGITKADLDTFLDLDGNKNYWRTDNQWWAYNLGSRVMEVFVAIKGPGVLLELHKQTVKQGFNQAFTSIFGQSWSSVRPILSKTLYELIKTGN